VALAGNFVTRSDSGIRTPPVRRVQERIEGKRGKPTQSSDAQQDPDDRSVFPQTYQRGQVCRWPPQQAQVGPESFKPYAAGEPQRRALELQVVRYRAHM